MSVDNKSYTTISHKILRWKTAKRQAILLVAHIFVNVHANQVDFTSDAKKTLACVASVSVGFGSKERDFWCFARAENGERAKNEI